jgi:hypothetical protein
MRVAIVQPPYLPWLGYFDLLRKVDRMVYLDTVNVNLRSFQRRNRIRTPTGSTWLTLPILKEQTGSPIFRNARTNDAIGWRQKHWRAIYSSYGRAPYFVDHRDFFEGFYAHAPSSLLDINVTLLQYLGKQLDVNTATCYASELEPQGAKTQLLIDICKKVGASAYLSGPTARNYLLPEMFKEENIALDFHEYTHPVYNQNFPGFAPRMSAIDLLFNVGPKATKIL